MLTLFVDGGRASITSCCRPELCVATIILYQLLLFDMLALLCRAMPPGVFRAAKNTGFY